MNSPGGNISHVVYIQFDNVHFERDNPNVPADLEQMPHLLNFLKNNGTFFANHHTPLISHTADDILTSLTGVYPDRHGQAVANSFVIWNLPANPYWDSFPSSFTYWTDQVSTSKTSDTNFSMITPEGLNAPAPWVPFTRLGCNVGAVSIANMELENVKGDITNVFGAGSPEAAEAKSNYYQAVADFEGISIHCAQGNAVCAGPHGRPDALPDEPGGYPTAPPNGFNALYGHKYVVPALIGTNKLNDLFGNLITDQSTPSNTGFPGFGDISPAQTLAYVATMLENGVPIVFSYISDAHDCHSPTPGDPPCAAVPAGQQTPGTFGSGEAGYVAQLQAYDKAFGLFFARLKNDGIDETNTLFIISADEQDHEVAGPPSPANCDGVNVPCTYTYSSGPNAGLRSVGEIDVDLPSLVNQQFPGLASNMWDFHYDMAPAVYLFDFGPPATQTAPLPVPTLPRQFEQAFSQLTAPNPITGNVDQLTRYMVDHVGLKALHMITGDPQRTPTFVMFANPDYYFEGSNVGEGVVPCTVRANCVVIQESGYAWNHGGVAPEINTTWFAMVGPGVKNLGVDRHIWSDEVDMRATMLLLTGLQDDYAGDGRVLVEALHDRALPQSLRGDDDDTPFLQLARAYKQINAPVGDFGQTTLRISTKALASDDANDATYTRLEDGLADLTSQRDSLAGKMISLFQGAEFGGERIDRHQADELVKQAERLLDQIHDLNHPDKDHDRN